MAKLKTFDDTVSDRDMLAAKGALKKIRGLRAPLDLCVDECHRTPSVRHVAEECLRAAAKGVPLWQVSAGDRLGVCERALSVLESQ